MNEAGTAASSRKEVIMMALPMLVLLIIALAFIAATAVRVRAGTIYHYDNERLSRFCFGTGYVCSALLAVSMSILFSGDDPRATYYINGAVVRGGTNWMIIVVTFIIGGGLIGLCVELASSWAARLIHSFSKEAREDRQARAPRLGARQATWSFIIAALTVPAANLATVLTNNALFAWLACSLFGGVGAACGTLSILASTRDSKKPHWQAIVGLAVSAILALAGITSITRLIR
jgi:hypothetical protein